MLPTNARKVILLAEFSRSKLLLDCPFLFFQIFLLSLLFELKGRNNEDFYGESEF